jgi:hypothetical protein
VIITKDSSIATPIRLPTDTKALDSVPMQHRPDCMRMAEICRREPSRVLTIGISPDDLGLRGLVE